MKNARPSLFRATPPGTSSKYSFGTRRPVNNRSVARSPRVRNGSIRSNTSDFLPSLSVCRKPTNGSNLAQMQAFSTSKYRTP